jgi:hypothetical protein
MSPSPLLGSCENASLLKSPLSADSLAFGWLTHKTKLTFTFAPLPPLHDQPRWDDIHAPPVSAESLVL